MHSLKNWILKTINILNVISFLFFMCCLDSESPVPMIMVFINLAWFGLYGLANDWFEEGAQ